MKLSKTLLSAIMIGIVVQTGTACKKDKESISAKAKKEAKKAGQKDSCPACGMG
jgi:hypothetical protein